MTVKPGRIYEVKPADFPIQVSVEARNLSACQAFAGDADILVGGVHAGSQPVSVVSSGMTKSYSIQMPAQASCDLISIITAFFSDQAADNSKYVVEIAASTGDTAVTTMSLPVLNPSVAALVFQLREDQPS